MMSKNEAPRLSLNAPNEKQMLTGLLTTPYKWDGTDTPSRTGAEPKGYNGDTGIREFRVGEHDSGYLSYGPYLEINGPGTLVEMIYFLDAKNLKNHDDVVFELDLVDNAAGGKKLINPLVVYVKDLINKNMACNVYLLGEVALTQGMNIESRVKVHGGGDVRFYGLFYGIHYL